MSTKHQVGDAVTRRVDVYDDTSRWRTGIVTEVYSAHSRFGFYPQLYAVRWDDGTEERGFLPHGLAAMK